MKRWLNVGVDTSVWPRAEIVVSYKGRTIHMLPRGDGTLPTVSAAFDDPGYMHPSSEDNAGDPRFADLTAAHKFIKEVLSILAWSTGYCMVERNPETGPKRGVMDYRPPNGAGSGIMFDHILDCLPEPADEDALLAIALYREGLGAGSVPYQFLSFVRVLNLEGDGNAQMAWINSHIDQKFEPYAQHRLDMLRRENKDVGKHLFVNGRCAIAHANADPRMNPDDPGDLFQLHEDLPLIRALAARYVARELGVKTPEMIAKERSDEMRADVEQAERDAASETDA